MDERNCVEMLNAKLDEDKHVCVGLDTDLKEISQDVEDFLRRKYRLPQTNSAGPLKLASNKEIIKATKDIAACYKLNRAFYEGMQGVWALHMTGKYIRDEAPSMPWIFDAKYGDVQNTCKAYAHYTFEDLKAYAVTVNPWGGYADGLDAFFEYKDKMVFVWCRGSNKGSREIQDALLIFGGLGGYEQHLFEYVAEIASGFNEYEGCVPERGWNINGNCSFVVGATCPSELKSVRQLVGDMPILVPGIGAQSGDLEAAVKAGGTRTIFNSSRGIIYKSKELDFAQVARKEVMRLNRQIRNILKGGDLNERAEGASDFK